ncbi:MULTISPECIES: MarR family winged helix-turn-helix transcriptional regulator [Corynebacterium]|uniref:MarR family winged helix-turn-helix transcriptional regulator n=1 Tax=Corynebacterium TaxID=1716 RepID=UPI0008A3E1FC|nr:MULTISPECIES: MarR family transcriptional regulator [Corynebacterium]OFT78139.1 MarR family transcriptional regulator [Corynebacterium sp. HMSC30G07]QQU84459.1 MarR family transcriptional regulator [Corynebacterium riegelii]
MSNEQDALELARRVRPAMTKLYVSYFRTAEHSELTGPQLSIMTRIAEHGPSRISQLADAEGVRMPTASNTINQLEKRGLVQRTRAVEDRRGVSVELTELGMQELKRVGEERTQSLAEMISTLDENHLKLIEQAADAINALAETYAEASSKRDLEHS